MSFLAGLKERYKSLPPLAVANKFVFIVWVFLFKVLKSKGVVDECGRLTMARFAKNPSNTPASTYKTLVGLTGFGYSGNTAVADLLLEYRNVTSTFPVASDSPNGGRNRFEFDFLRCAGGVFSFEHAFATRNEFERDAAVHAFLAVISNLYLNTKGFFGDDFLALTRIFLDGLIEAKCPSSSGFDFCPHFSGLGNLGERLVWGQELPLQSKGYVFYLKNISVAEYRALANKYVLAVLRTIESNDYLAILHLVGDSSADMDMYRDYLGDIKLIAVYRDPRDVYAMKIERSIAWIPSVDDGFAKWYRNKVDRYMQLRDKNFLMLRFEDLVLNYEDSKRKIQTFLGLTNADHVSPKTSLIPEKSALTVGIWRKCPAQHEMAVILSELSDYCWRE